MRFIKYLLFVVVFSIAPESTLFGQTDYYDIHRNAITAEVNSMYGERYDITVHLIDSLLGRNLGWGSVIEDPYGTLAACTIFEARGLRQENGECPNGFVGVFKNGHIIWHSDTLINSIEGMSPSLNTTQDLNRDGKVEMVFDWFSGMRFDVDYLWIFSWDGENGDLLITFDSSPDGIQRGLSDLISLSGSIKFGDIDLDGTTEIVCEWPVDTNVIYKWDGNFFSKWSESSEYQSPRFLPRNGVTANINAKVTKIESSFNFRYTVKNDTDSYQKIKDIYIYSDTPISIFDITSRHRWHVMLFDFDDINFINWFDLTRLYLMNEGETDSNFSFKTNNLPGVVPYYIQGANVATFEPKEKSVEELRNDIINNSFKGYTIGPRNFTLPCDLLTFLDTLRSYINQSRSLGWITDQTTADKYSRLVDSARSKLSQLNITQLHFVLDTVLTEINNDSTATLSSEAYALLRFNVEYIVNTLPQEESAHTFKFDIVGEGTIQKSPEQCFYTDGAIVQLTATASPGYIFSAWSGDVPSGSETDNPLSLTVDNTKKVIATFKHK